MTIVVPHLCFPVITMPNAYEVFIRTFLAHAASPVVDVDGCATSDQQKSCRTNGHQCIAGDCIQSTAYYHDAVSPAFVASADGNTFSVNSTLAQTYESTLWTEP
jgi:hypothetical protein